MANLLHGRGLAPLSAAASVNPLLSGSTAMPVFVAYIKADLENVGSASVDVETATLTIDVKQGQSDETRESVTICARARVPLDGVSRHRQLGPQRLEGELFRADGGRIHDAVQESGLGGNTDRWRGG